MSVMRAILSVAGSEGADPHQFFDIALLALLEGCASKPTNTTALSEPIEMQKRSISWG